MTNHKFIILEGLDGKDSWIKPKCTCGWMGKSFPWNEKDTYHDCLENWEQHVETDLLKNKMVIA